ncbi:choice-of-anchor Q domain-containing protein [Fischerella sp. JS2]|uniref:choice-of-anchor Q domain-containing protein n=1 Tax=Fischerella sp. JS2 TaxID=2597771 RepID=UPI0028E75892|nr:choice-of-anchor Q domain-containing protein [Fischerella sp. JS2]
MANTLGTNLSGVSDHSSGLPFLDHFKTASDWMSQNSKIGEKPQGIQLDLDKTGWEKSLPNSGVSTWLHKDLGIKDNGLHSSNNSNLFSGTEDRQLLSNDDNDKLRGNIDRDVLTGIKDKPTSDTRPETTTSDILGTSIISDSTHKPAVLAATTDSSQSHNSGDVYYVSPNGSDDNPGTLDKPWKTVNHAVNEKSPVKAGDTILVQPGTYTEIITLGKSGDSKLGDITLKANGDVTLRDPDPNSGFFREGVIQSAGKGNWVIDGFRIENTSWAGISLRDAYNMTVQNNHTYETGASGIIVMPDTYYNGGEGEVTSKNIKVLNNTVERASWIWKGNAAKQGNINDGFDLTTSTQESLSIWGVDGFEVANNTVKEGNREGIDIKTGSRNGSVHDNTVTGQAIVSGTPDGYSGGPALYIEGNRADMFNIDVYNNVVANNTAGGLVITDEVPNQGDVSDIRVYNNIVLDNGKDGVNSGQGIGVSSNVSNVEIVNNTIDGNVQGFLIDGSDNYGGYKPKNILVRNNIFANSSFRNGLVEDAENVTLDHNLFTNKFAKAYETGNGVSNLQAENNTQADSVGFADLAGNNFNLTANSPAIDTGSAAITDYAKLDHNGKQRGQGKGVDIGAYEFQS